MEVSLRLSSSLGKICGPWSCCHNIWGWDRELSTLAISGDPVGCQTRVTPQFWPGHRASGCLWCLLTPFLPAQLPLVGLSPCYRSFLLLLLQKGAVSSSSCGRLSCSAEPSWLSVHGHARTHARTDTHKDSDTNTLTHTPRGRDRDRDRETDRE